ncbi:MAG: hypothetical protein JNM13_04925 [Hyphomicrobiaceae bacterium]|nr:hypothetical protein [Hyphomicrobiaceae bacterium]
MKTSTGPTVSATELADILGCDARTVRNLAGRHPNIRAGRGAYSLKSAIAARVADAGRSRAGDAEAAERAALLAAQRRTAELRLAERQRELIPLTEAMAILDDVVATLRHALDAVPAQISRDPEARNHARDLIDAALERAAAKFKALETGETFHEVADEN